MNTLADVKAAVRARGYETDMDANMTILATSVQRDILGAHRWRFARASTTIAAVAGTATYSVPALTQHIESVRLAYPSQTYIELIAAEPDDLLEAAAYAAANGFNPWPGTGAWSETLPGTIQLFPAPLQAGTITVRTLTYPADFASDSDVPLIPLPYRDTIVAGVCEILATREKQLDVAALCRAEKDRRVSAMQAQYGMSQQQTATRVARSGFVPYGSSVLGGYLGRSW
jgi:hypothetical protein